MSFRTTQADDGPLILAILYFAKEGFGELPHREADPKALKTLEQALAAISDDVNIELTSDQRDVRLPSQADLF